MDICTRDTLTTLTSLLHIKCGNLAIAKPRKFKNKDKQEAHGPSCAHMNEIAKYNLL